MQDQRLVPLVARVLGSAAIFVMFGWGKLIGGAATVAYMAKDGLPVPLLAAIVTTVVELGGGVLLLLGLFTRPAALVLMLWCFATALVVHTDWSNPANKINFMKNFAMAGGYVAIAAIGAGEISLDAMLRRRRVVVRA